MTSSASTALLPNDLLLSIFKHLAVKDILGLREVCRHFRNASELRSVWYHILQATLRKQSIPIPGLREDSIENLDTRQLERLVRNALRVRRSWTLAAPIPARELSLTPSLSSRIIIMRFFHLRGESYLLTVAVPVSQPSTRTLECWSLADSPPRSVAHRVIAGTPGVLPTIAVSKSPAPVVLAVHHSRLEILAIDLDSPDGFLNVPSTPDVPAAPLAICPSSSDFWIISRPLSFQSDHSTNPFIWNTASPDKLMELVTTYPSQSERSFEALFFDSFIVLLRVQSIAIYALDGVVDGKLIPIIEHRFGFAIDEGRMARVCDPLYPEKGTKINLLLRFTSGFPWPVNVLQHFTLTPNFLFDPANPSHTNCPYSFPPVFIQTISAPVRLFTITDMAIGDYGSAVWIDTHTEDYFNQASHGQRLAGRILQEQQSSDGEGEAKGGIEMTSTAGSVYTVQEYDTFIKVAVDDGGSRVAVAHLSGEIRIYDYGAALPLR